MDQMSGVAVSIPSRSQNSSIKMPMCPALSFRKMGSMRYFLLLCHVAPPPSNCLICQSNKETLKKNEIYN